MLCCARCPCDVLVARMRCLLCIAMHAQTRISSCACHFPQNTEPVFYPCVCFDYNFVHIDVQVTVRDLWAHADLGAMSSLTAALAGGGQSMTFKLSPASTNALSATYLPCSDAGK